MGGAGGGTGVASGVGSWALAIPLVGVEVVSSVEEEGGSAASDAWGSSDLMTNLWPGPQETHWTRPRIVGSERYSPFDIKVCRMRLIFTAKHSAISAGEGGIRQRVETMIGRKQCVC